MGELRWSEQDKAAVAARLRAGGRPAMATTTATGPLGELVAPHDELGGSLAQEQVATARRRAGSAARPLPRTLAVLPCVGSGGLRGVADQRCGAPAILLQLGRGPVQLRRGDNGRQRRAAGRADESPPCHPDTRRDALARSGEPAWLQAQRVAAQGLYARGLVRGRGQAIAGPGRGTARSGVALVGVSGPRPVVVAWRYVEGRASAKGQAAAVTRALVEQVLAAGGTGRIARLLAWLKCVHGIAAPVRLPADRLRHAALPGLAAGQRLTWHEHRYARTLRGHKWRRTAALAGVGQLDRWASSCGAAATQGQPGARRWACLARERAPTDQPPAEATALVRTRAWAQPWAASQAYRGRRASEDDTSRARKAGWGLARQPRGAQHQAVRGRVRLTLLAFNPAQIYRTRGWQHRADKGPRRRRQLRRREPGPAPGGVYLDGRYRACPVDEVFARRGAPGRASLLPRAGPHAT